MSNFLSVESILSAAFWTWLIQQMRGVQVSPCMCGRMSVCGLDCACSMSWCIWSSHHFLKSCMCGYWLLTLKVKTRIRVQRSKTAYATNNSNYIMYAVCINSLLTWCIVVDNLLFSFVPHDTIVQKDHFWFASLLYNMYKKIFTGTFIVNYRSSLFY